MHTLLCSPLARAVWGNIILCLNPLTSLLAQHSGERKHVLGHFGASKQKVQMRLVNMGHCSNFPHSDSRFIVAQGTMGYKTDLRNYWPACTGRGINRNHWGNMGGPIICNTQTMVIISYLSQQILHVRLSLCASWARSARLRTCQKPHARNVWCRRSGNLCINSLRLTESRFSLVLLAATNAWKLQHSLD